MKWQTKYLSSDITSDQTISDLTFSLEIGKTYKITIVPLLKTNATDSSVQLEVYDGAVQLADIVAVNSTAGTANTKQWTLIRTMTDTSLTFVSDSATANAFVAGDGTSKETFVTVEQLPHHRNTSEW